MRFTDQPAYILHARPYRETSLLLEVFTREHGRIGLVARGVRRERSRMPRGLLQPFQPLLLGWVARGELGTLTAVEVASTPLPLSGDALLAAMYVNELVLRLSGRNDVHSDAFSAYAQCLARLSEEPDIAWTLRRFERDLLGHLGYGLALLQSASGAPIEADIDYAYDPESGARIWHDDSPFPRIAGATLQALDGDERPSAEQLAQLRRLIRVVIRHLLGGDLKAWALSARPAADRSA